MDPDLSQDQREQVIQRVEDLITQMDGFLVLTDEWGERKLAYDIKKRSRGYYVRFDYCGLSPLVNEIERFFRIDDRALKYMTVLLDKVTDLDKIKEDKAEAESKAAVEEAQAVSSPVEETAPVADTTAEDTAAAEAPADDTPVAEAPADADETPAKAEKPEIVEPAAAESNSATETTPSKKPEEA
jgi:small subunit ribosomal protein S6